MGRKNNKKSFSDGLESVFEHTLFEDNLQDNPSMFLEDTTKAKKEKKKKSTRKTRKTTKNKAKKRKSSRKSFSSNLESFFKDSIEDAMEGMVTEIKRNIVKKNNKKAIGIDVLLRRTTNESVDDIAPRQQPKTKRITFVLETEKIEQFKTVARSRKERLRKIIGELIDEYIKENQE